MNTMDARSLGVLDSLPCGVHIGQHAAGEGRDDRTAHLFGDGPHRLEVARRACREARLDNIHAQPVELPCDFQLLRRRQPDSADCSPSRSVVSKIITLSSDISISCEYLVVQSVSASVFQSVSISIIKQCVKPPLLTN